MYNQIPEIKISYSTKNLTKKQIKSSREAAEFLIDSWNLDEIEAREEFKVVLLNSSNSVLGIYEVSKGGISATLVDIRLVFAVALKSLSVGMILAHNHPSGNLNPSSSDLKLTKQIKDAGELLKIKVLDHIIITPNESYYSFSDEGIL